MVLRSSRWKRELLFYDKSTIFDPVTHFLDKMSKKASSPHYDLLPDCVKPGIKLLIVGINPGIHSAESRHHFAGPHNHFWSCLYNSNLVDKPLTSNDDHLLPKNYEIGLTNIVKRPTRAASELTKEEFQKGALEILQLIGNYRPKIVVFNGVSVYRTFLEYALGLPKKVWNMKIVYGRQPDFISDCILFAMPSSSPRAAAYPTAKDKLPFYVAIKEMLDEQ